MINLDSFKYYFHSGKGIFYGSDEKTPVEGFVSCTKKFVETYFENSSIEAKEYAKKIWDTKHDSLIADGLSETSIILLIGERP